MLKTKGIEKEAETGGMPPQEKPREPMKSLVQGLKSPEAAYALADPDEKTKLDSLYKRMQYASVGFASCVQGAVASLALGAGASSMTFMAYAGTGFAPAIAKATSLGMHEISTVGFVSVCLMGSAFAYFIYNGAKAANDWYAANKEKKALLDGTLKRAQEF